MVDDELPMFSNQIPHDPLPQPTIVDDIPDYQQVKPSVLNLSNPATPEILNQETARKYTYIKSKRRY